MKVLICGGRKWGYRWSDRWRQWIKDYNQFNEEAKYIVENYKPTFVITGGAHGADEIGYSIRGFGVDGRVYPADWKTRGGAAGPIRNQQMLDEGKPDLVIAYPGGNGTEDMIRRAKKAGVKVIEIKE